MLLDKRFSHLRPTVFLLECVWDSGSFMKIKYLALKMMDLYVRGGQLRRDGMERAFHEWRSEAPTGHILKFSMTELAARILSLADPIENSALLLWLKCGRPRVSHQPRVSLRPAFSIPVVFLLIGKRTFLRNIFHTLLNFSMYVYTNVCFCCL